MPQKSLASLFENERHKASAFRDPPGVQRAIRKNFSFSSREKSPLVYSPIPRPERFRAGSREPNRTVNCSHTTPVLDGSPRSRRRQ